MVVLVIGGVVWLWNFLLGGPPDQDNTISQTDLLPENMELISSRPVLGYWIKNSEAYYW